MSDTIIRKQTAPKITSKYTDWDLFREAVHNNTSLRLALKTPQDVETAVDIFTSTLVSAAKEATPLNLKKYIEKFQVFPEVLGLGNSSNASLSISSRVAE